MKVSFSLYIKAVPLQAWSGPEDSRKLRFSDFVTTEQDGGRLPALSTGRLYPPGNTPGTHFCWRLSQPQGHSAIGRIMSTKISNDTIGNLTRELNQLSQRVPQTFNDWVYSNTTAQDGGMGLICSTVKCIRYCTMNRGLRYVKS